MCRVFTALADGAQLQCGHRCHVAYICMAWLASWFLDPIAWVVHTCSCCMLCAAWCQWWGEASDWRPLGKSVCSRQKRTKIYEAKFDAFYRYGMKCFYHILVTLSPSSTVWSIEVSHHCQWGKSGFNTYPPGDLLVRLHDNWIRDVYKFERWWTKRTMPNFYTNQVKWFDVSAYFGAK